MCNQYAHNRMKNQKESRVSLPHREFVELRKIYVCDFLFLVWLIDRSIAVIHAFAHTLTARIALTFYPAIFCCSHVFQQEGLLLVADVIFSLTSIS